MISETSVKRKVAAREKRGSNFLTHQGVYYFSTYTKAAEFANLRGHPKNRVIPYDLGWAIQLHISGPYVGPDTHTHAGNPR